MSKYIEEISEASGIPEKRFNSIVPGTSGSDIDEETARKIKLHDLDIIINCDSNRDDSNE